MINLYICSFYDSKRQNPIENVGSFSFRLPQIGIILGKKLDNVKASATFSTLDCGFPREGKH